MLLDALFGGSCFLCRGSARGLLCPACDADLPRLRGPLCPRCALASASGALCGRCLARAPHYDATVAALGYRFPADVLVHALKFQGQLALAPKLGGLLAQAIAVAVPQRIDVIIPVPLSAARLAARGYNQAMEIARPLARATGARLEPGLCERLRDTPAQVELPFAERVANVRGAFDCPRLVAGLSIAVVDDVMTTGSTLDEVARTLKAAGAVSVVNWVAARTAPPEDGAAA
jgi:ComF family protein